MLREVPREEPLADYTELGANDRIAILHAMIRNAEEQLVQVRMNRAIQARFINAPLPESRKSIAKQAFKNFEAQATELEISAIVLREELAALEAIAPPAQEGED